MRKQHQGDHLSHRSKSKDPGRPDQRLLLASERSGGQIRGARTTLLLLRTIEINRSTAAMGEKTLGKDGLQMTCSFSHSISNNSKTLRGRIHKV